MKATQDLFNATTKARDLLASRVKDVEVAMKIQDREINRLRMENQDLLKSPVSKKEEIKCLKLEHIIVWVSVGFILGLIVGASIFNAAQDIVIG